MKKIFITGSTRGIGYHIAKRFLQDERYEIIVHGKNPKSKDFLSNLFGKENINRLTYFPLDLSNPNIVEKTELPLDGLEIFINNAGIYESAPPIELININLTSSILLTKKVYSYFKNKGGTIININSVAGLFPNFNESVYCSTKFGLDGFFKSLQTECFKDKIRIQQYYLGATKSDMTINRSDFDLLIDPIEVSELVYRDLKFQSMTPTSTIIKRKKY